MPVTPDGLPEVVRPVGADCNNGRIWLLSGDNWAPSVAAAIDSAESSVRIAMYSISVDTDDKDPHRAGVYLSLLEAPLRRVDCRAVLAIHRRGSATARFNHASGRAMQEAGWIVRDHPSSRLLHAKLIIVDDHLVFTGSHNMTKQAARRNVELSVATTNRHIVEMSRAFFDRTFSGAKKRGER